MFSWWRQITQVRLLPVAPMSVSFEEEYLTKYSSGILLTTPGSESHTDLPQILSENYVHGFSGITREIYNDVEEDTTYYIYCVGL